MKKSTIGLILFAFGLFGIIVGAQDSGPKTPPEVFVAGAVLCVVGFILFLVGRKRAPRAPTASTVQGSEEGVATEVKSTPGEPTHCVWTGRAPSYVIPRGCCACSGPVERTISISCLQTIGNRTLRLEFPICRSCYKERYRIAKFKMIEPVTMRLHYNPDRMEFKFSNREFAEMFAKMNKGEFLKPL
jgi:hypothetical protein